MQVAPGPQIQMQPMAMGQPTMPPQQMVMVNPGTALLSALGQTNEVHIVQGVDPSTAITKCCSCLPNCCDQPNEYSGYPTSITLKPQKDGPHKGYPVLPVEGKLFSMKERSSCPARVCCCGMHDFQMDVTSLANGQFQHTHTIVRPGCGSGKCCLCLPSCAGPCTEEWQMYEKNAVGGSEPLFQAKETKCCLNPCSLQLGIHAQNDPTPAYQVNGPCFFGGCKSLFCDDKFPIRDMEGKQLGELKKHAPRSCGDCLKEIFTDADDYAVQFQPEATEDARLGMLTATIMADIILFEKDKGPCWCENPCACDFAITVCNCYVCGCFRPCYIKSKWYRKYILCWPYFGLWPCCVCCNAIPCCNQFN
jgi:hypothetical protein